jgi:type I restriction enzyme R subunit
MSGNEAQTRRDLIDPKIFELGWTNDLVKPEQATPGGADIVDGRPVRRKGRTDYLLCLPVKEGQPPLPVAVLEAKKEDSSASQGLQQARDYAKRFNVIFSFSSNGHLFSEYAQDTDQIRENIPLNEFPTPDELRKRYEAFKKINLESKNAQALFVKYKGGEAARFYFQDAAIRAILEKIALGKKKVLLSLATGTGKTHIAKHLFWKLAQAGEIRRALFVVDRDELRTQAITHLQGMFGDDAQEVTTSNPKGNAKILIATYHTLNITSDDKEPKFWKENFPKNYFSHIIIDECHRSAWGKWRVILEDNPDAVHIGLTATPRRLTGVQPAPEDEAITANNIAYFGEPVYEYSITQGQEDGYLAACEVIQKFVTLDGTIIQKEELKQKKIADAHTGGKVADEDLQDTYNASAYEKTLLLEDRMNRMTADLFAHLLKTGGVHQKTIIFCASDDHAGQIAVKMQNLYLDWCRQNGAAPREMYAFRCTASEQNPSAKDLIKELRGSNHSHYIATTVELLSTGVDIPNLNNVVFFKYVASPISFYQMVGRGTRIGEPRGSKMMFRLYDYTNATRLFGQEFITRPASEKTDGEGGAERERKIVRVAQEQYEVHVQDKGVSILCEEDGKEVLVPYEIYKARLAEKVAEQIRDVNHLRKTWVSPPLRAGLLAGLPGGEGAIRLVRELEDEQECDLYDVLAELTFGLDPKTRAERAAAFGFKNRAWLNQYPERTRGVVTAIAMQFAKGGIEELESESLFDAPEVLNAGGFDTLLKLPQPPDYFVEETKVRLLA